MKVKSMQVSPLKQKFGEVHKAIVTGDIVAFRLLLGNDVSKVRNILNNLVTYKATTDHNLFFELPLALAACSGNTEMLITVMELIRDMNQQDESGNNIIHCLVLLSEELPVVACDMYSTLMSHIDHNMKLKLLITENQEQLTSLSLAAQTCVPEIMHCILNTERVFRFELDINGPYREVKYKFNKEHNPIEILHQVTGLPENKLRRFTDCGILHTSPLKEIRNSINKKGRYMFYIWMMFIITTVITYGVYLRSYLRFGSVPSKTFNAVAAATLGIYCLKFVHNLYVNKKNTLVWWRKALYNSPPVIINYLRSNEIIFYTMFFVIAVLDLVHPDCDNDTKVRHILHGITSFFAIRSLLSLLEAYPRTAYLMAVAQKMTEETMAFMALGFLSYAAFAAVFYILETPFQCINPVKANNSTTNPENIPSAMYNAFLRLLDIKAPEDVYFSESQVPSMSIAVYVFAIIIWPVMLLNFLIALYNDKMQTITQHREVITAVQNMNIMLFTHDTYYVPFQKVKKRIYKLIGFDNTPGAEEVIVYTLERLLK